MLAVTAPSLAADQVLRCCARGNRPFLIEGARFSFAGCDPDDGFTWSRGQAGDPFLLIEAAQRRWTVGPVDENWPIAAGYLLDGPQIDLAHYPAVWRLDRERDAAQVLAHSPAAAEQLLARLQRAPVPLHPARVGPLSSTESGFAATSEDEGTLAVYLALRNAWPDRSSTFFATDLGATFAITAPRLLRVETVKVAGRYVTNTLSTLGDTSAADGTGHALRRVLGSYPAAVGWIGAGRAL